MNRLVGRNRRGRVRAKLAPAIQLERLESRELLAIFTVTSAADAGTGTLREAITLANGSSGTDTIAFDISGPSVITALSALPIITDPVIIDGSTQPGYSGAPLIQLDGNGIAGDGLRISAGNSTVRGLAVTRFAGAGIRLDTLGGNTIEGCHIGVDRAGNTAQGNGAQGLFVSSGGNTIGGTGTAGRNVISGNTADGIQLFATAASNNVVRNTYIGTNRAGTAPVPNQAFGLVINSGASNTIGSTTGSLRNIISGNNAGGILILGDPATGNIVRGNYIGVDATGALPLGNRHNGILINGARDSVIGGTTASSSNTIANNGGTNSAYAGVNVFAGTGNSILTNSIYGNAGLGIDLGSDGITLNDVTDGDSGANNLQNYPTIFFATTLGNSSTIQGTVQGAASTSYTVQFFENFSPDSNGFGEGQRFIGQTVITTDATGFSSYSVNFPTALSGSSGISATATDPLGNTSEFSANAPVFVGFFTLTDLSVSITDSTDPVDAGQPLTYTIFARNEGFATAGGVVASITLPNSLIFQSATTSRGSFSVSGQNLNFNLGSLDINASATMTVTVLPSLPGNVSTRVTITGNVTDFDPSNNSATVDTQVNLAPNTALLNLLTSEFSVGESDGFATVTVTRSNNFAGIVSVDYATSDGTAIGGQKYTPTSGTLIFGVNELSKTFSIPITDNDIIEGNQTIFVQLSNPSFGAIVGNPSRGVVTVYDNDPPPPAIQYLAFDQPTFQVLENATSAVVTVRRTGSTVGAVRVNYATSNGTAIAGIDYDQTNGTLEFTDGEATKTFIVPIRNNLVLDNNRTFSVALSSSIAAVIGTQSTATVTIVDDEIPTNGFIQFDSSTYTGTEGANSNTVNIRITRVGGSATSSVRVTTSGGTAVPGQRYVPLDTTVTFLPNETEKILPLTLIDTPGFEGSQTVGLVLEAVGGFTLGTPATATLTISDNDGDIRPISKLSFSTATYQISESAGQALITLVRTETTLGTATIVFQTTAGGSAVPGVDYTSVSTTVTFLEGETSKTVAIPVLTDGVVDGTKTVSLALATPGANTEIGGIATAVLSILNVDLDTTPPAVLAGGIRLVVGRGGYTGFTVQFDQAIDAATASQLASYSVIDLGRNRLPGGGDDRGVPLRSVAWNSSTNTATILFDRAVPLRQFVQVTVADTILDQSGNALDGNADGLPGGNSVTIIGRATSISYTDADGDLVNLQLRGGGQIELTRASSGDGQVVRLLNTRNYRSVLSGSVTRGGAGDGRTTLQKIEGLDPFGRVRSELTTPPFLLAEQLNPVAVDLTIARLGRLRAARR